MSGTWTDKDGDGGLRALVDHLVERDVVLTARVEQLAARNAALAAEMWAGREPSWPRLPRRLAVGLASALAVLVALAPLAALAVVDLFGDVPTGAQFHNEINAIARAGITTGCSAGTPPNYCPDDAVTRRAMAAFMSRGFGRVAGKSLPTVNPVPSTSSTISNWGVTITPGLPAGALSGATGFLKVDAWVAVAALSGGPCLYGARLVVDSTSVGNVSETTLDFDSIYRASLPLTHAVGVTGSTARTVEVRVFRISGGDGCSALAFGGLTVLYVPFGSTGGNTL